MRASDLLLEIVPDKDGAGAGEYRTVSERVVVGRVGIPRDQARSTRRWRRQLALKISGPGNIQVLYPDSIAGYPADDDFLISLFSWVQEQGLPDLREKADVTIVGCKAAHFHHDISGFADSVFCIAWLEPTQGLDLVFPDLGKRVPLDMGTVVLFDAAQPHAVLKTEHTRFDAEDHLVTPVQALISINIETDWPGVAEAMGIQVSGSAQGWRGTMVEMTSDGPDIDSATGHWAAELSPTHL